MKANIDYWRDIYVNRKVPVFPSQFAMFVQSWLTETNYNLLEFGCGNGRDSMFFQNMGHNVIATDQCIGEELKQLALESQNMVCVESDVVDISSSIADHFNNDNKNVIYSRFFQHAIDSESEKIMLESLYKNTPQNTTLFFEFRLYEDIHTDKVYGSDHYRRFQTDDDFVELLENCGFTCDYRCKGQGYATFAAEDPVVGRFVASPNERVKLRTV